MSEHRASFSTFIFLGFSTLVALADQLIKWLVQQSMAYGQSVEITPFFNWVHVWNKGAAFSLFADGGGWHWPAFNLADVFIVLGVTMIFVTGFRAEKSAGNNTK